MNHSQPTRIPACPLRRALAVLTIACAALLGVPQAFATTTIDVPCGTAIDIRQSDVVVRLQACDYPYFYLAGFPIVVEGNGAVINIPAGTGATYALGDITLRNLRITGGQYGGLFLPGNGHVTLDHVVVSGNSNLTDHYDASSHGGGGITAGYDGNLTLTLVDSTVSNNIGRSGGGIWFKFVDVGPPTLNIVRSTISGNRAMRVDGDQSSGLGGGVYIHKSNVYPATVHIENSTLSGNHADIYGGALVVEGVLLPTIEDSTITNNRADFNNDAIFENTTTVSGMGENSGVHLKRTIIAGNGLDSVPDCSPSDFRRDYGYNVLVAECVGVFGSQATTQIIATDGALLEPLADNGGPTQTHLPLADSPVLDVIPPGTFGCGTDPATDQRGVTRPQLGGCDIGAVEATDTYPPVADPTLSSSPNAAGWYNAPVTVTWNWDDGVGAGINPANCTTSSTSSGEGEITLSASCADLAGNLGNSSRVVKVDTIAPETTFTVMPPASTTETSALFSFNGSDTTSGLGGFECQLDAGTFSPCTSPQSFSGLALGSHTLTVRSIDVAGHVDATPASFTWSIVPTPTTISWSGVLQPINADGSSVFKAGSVVPVKFELTGASAGRTDLVARLSYAKISNKVAGPVNEATAPGQGTSGNQFRYDPATGQYSFNWSTKGLVAGTYELTIDLGDGNLHRVGLGLR